MKCHREQIVRGGARREQDIWGEKGSKASVKKKKAEELGRSSPSCHYPLDGKGQ